MLMAYERALYTPGANVKALGDGSLRIPERSNGYPDWLDEARWEMAFMLKMQVPTNSPPQLVNGEYIDVSGMVSLSCGACYDINSSAKRPLIKNPGPP